LSTDGWRSVAEKWRGVLCGEETTKKTAATDIVTGHVPSRHRQLIQAKLWRNRSVRDQGFCGSLWSFQFTHSRRCLILSWLGLDNVLALSSKAILLFKLLLAVPWLVDSSQAASFSYHSTYQNLRSYRLRPSLITTPRLSFTPMRIIFINLVFSPLWISPRVGVYLRL